ncbi:MAG: hypothetical protein A2096_04850 [Spirochaetes bacterium GWF1_41_5]|nr:MAG: hypothetical protein A2096_04850 [Spirochaetes bacterium GWF1_41_5]HBE02691.1 4-hydroxybenzoyl-CoA thioesterase [Spirochaetia bacterium]
MPALLTASCERPVRFSETDPLGIVWHGNYIKYFEDSREVFGEKYGLEYLTMYENGFSAPLVDMRCSWRSPLHYRDIFISEITFVPCEAAKIIFTYRVMNKALGTLCASGESTQVFMNKNGELLFTIPDFFQEWKKKNQV